VVPGFWLLASARIQKEVGITEAQKLKLADMSGKYQAAMRRMLDPLANLSEGEQKRRMAALREPINTLLLAARRKAETILTRQQARALRKIDLQMRAAGTLMNPKVQEQLELTDEQRDDLQRIYKAAEEKSQQVQRETGERVLGVLNPDQAEKLRSQMDAQGP
jgi:predicted transcriptional regulator